MSVDHFKRIYTGQAEAYHAMIAAEDADGHLRPALEAVTPLAGKRILDLGTGTGRLPLLLAHEAGLLVGVDLHAAMLRENARQRAKVGGAWPLAQADMRRLPLPNGWAQVVLAGWALGHLRGWHADDWRGQIGQVLGEMERVAETGGALIIMETMTTGSLTPAPPSAQLAEYYSWLESDWGFERRAISTDYVFASVEQAVTQTEFFFGAELAGTIRRNGWSRLPEWTGLWHKRAPLSASPR